MFDYERYDHTYCRLSKDVEESGTLKRRFSSASYEALSDVDIGEHITSQISVERDNGVSLNREPVIIVRTKKARKTAPIIVKAMDKDKGAVLVSAVNTAKNTNSIISKNKIVSSVVEKSAGHDAAENPKVVTADSNKEENAAVPDIVATGFLVDTTPVVQTTKSGRARKLTAKAKQMSDESVSKARKSPKAKTSVNKESVAKRSRGRPRKSATSNESKPSGSTAIPEPVEGVNNEPKCSSNRVESDELSLTNGDSKAMAAETNKQQSKTKKAASGKSSPTKASHVSNRSTPKSVQTKKSVSAKSKVRPKSTATKRSTKQAAKTKLVVVTKPPPKRRAQLRAQEQMAGGKHGSQNIPAAKIDSSNIVRGNRRRR